VPYARLAIDGSPASIVTREAHEESDDSVIDAATTPTIDPFLPDDTLSDNTSHNPGRVDARKVSKWHCGK
jgi:hypothetical protein